MESPLLYAQAPAPRKHEMPGTWGHWAPGPLDIRNPTIVIIPRYQSHRGGQLGSQPAGGYNLTYF